MVLSIIAISAISTGLAEIITLPICSVKTNHQLSSQSQSIKETILNMYRIGGIKIFYNASIPAMSSQILSTSSKYTIYTSLENIFNVEQKQKYKFINGLLSGWITSLITHPIDVFKINWQTNQKIRPFYEKEGLKSLYIGYSKTLSKTSLGSCLYFPIYDYFHKTFSNHAVAASMVSGLVSTLIIHPVDFLKTRHIGRKSLFLGWNPILYYRGLSINIARVVPHFTIVMSSIDYLKKNINKTQ